MGTITRSTKQGGATTLADGQTAPAADVETDLATLFALVNGEVDDANVKTAEAPGAKSWRFKEISAPSNPSANDLLVYALDVGGTTILQGHDSAGTTLDLTRRIGARVYNTANIDLADSTVVALTFDTERYDVGGCHSTSSNTGRLTAPIAGKYLITGHVRFSIDTDYTRLALLIRLNGATFLASLEEAAVFRTGVVQDRSIATIYALAAADYVELTAFQVNTDAGTETADAEANLSPEFAMHYLGN